MAVSSSLGIPDTIKETIRRIQTLPTLPQVALDVMAMARDESVTMAQVAGRIDGDPAISSKLLRVANSVHYGLPKSVRTVGGAILVMGLKQVQHLILGVSAYKAFPEVPGKPSFDRERFWRHSASVGYVARLLAERLCLPVNGEEFSGGVLHDVGTIVLDQFFHRQWVEAMDIQIRKNMSREDAEAKVFGTTHTEIGGWMLNYWKLPLSLARCAAFHHHPDKTGGDPTLVSLVALADRVAKEHGLGFEEEIEEFPLELHPGWEILKRENPFLREVDPAAICLGVKEALEDAQRLGELNWFR